MVVPPIAIYGAAATSYTLSKELYGIIKSICEYKKDLKKLGYQFVDNEQKFDILITSFQEIRESVVPEHRTFVDTISQHLNEELQTAKANIKKYNRIQWPFVKKAMTSAIDALSEWIERFQARYAMLPEDLKKRFQDKTVSDKYKAERDGPLAGLNAHIEMRAAQLSLEKENIEKTLASKGTEPSDEEIRDVRRFRYPKDIIKIPEHIRTDSFELRKFELEVARLATVLKAAHPKLTHLPKAVSWFEQKYPAESTPHSFGIAYQVPDSVKEALSLKDVIKLGPPQHSLSDRMNLALDFVSAMAYVRGLEWVHKAIRSSNILLFYGQNDESAPQKLGHVNLVGFSIARRGTGEVRSTSGDNERFWQNQVYCHPDRQTVNILADDIAFKAAQTEAHNPSALSPGKHVSDGTGSTGASSSHGSAKSTSNQKLTYYRYVHDIYSIGVVLLEIGLWQDLTPSSSALRTAEPEKRRQLLLEMTQNELPINAGKKYASVVRACLEADDDGPGVPDVLSRLAQIQL